MSTALRRPGRTGHKRGRSRVTLTATDVGRLAEQRMRSAVNFGVASARRASGARPDELLDLRCECGGPDCRAAVRISLRDYDAAPLRQGLLVRPDHIDQERHRPRTLTDRWAVIEGALSSRRPTHGGKQ